MQAAVRCGRGSAGSCKMWVGQWRQLWDVGGAVQAAVGCGRGSAGSCEMCVGQCRQLLDVGGAMQATVNHTAFQHVVCCSLWQPETVCCLHTGNHSSNKFCDQDTPGSSGCLLR